MIKQDQLWPGGFRFLFDDELFQPGTDSFLLGSFPRLRLVQNTAQAAPKLLLLEAKKGGRPGLAVLPPLLLRDPDGGESAELSRIYFRDKE